MESKEFYDFLIKVQSIAKIGLKFSTDPYALSNYEEINKLTLDMLEKFMEVKFDRPNFFERDIYPTPSISTRTVILNDTKDKVLLVREAALQTYSLPGGWADLYDSPSVAAKTECMQEAGADVEIVRLVGILDRTPFKRSGTVPEYVIVFEAKIKGELKEHEYETDEVNYYPIDNLPEISRKATKEEVLRMIKAVVNNETIFD